MNINDSISSRISILRFIMIVGVVVLHTPQYVPIAEIGNGAFDLFKAFFQHAVFRASVPVLTFISGYLLFKSGMDLTPAKLFRKKGRSIGIPFLFFNFLLLAAAYAAQTKFAITLPYQLAPFNVSVWLDAAFGLKGSPINYPLNFLRDLIAVMLLAPIFGYMIRNMPIKGLILITLVFLWNFDSFFVIRADMPIVFYVGGMAAINRWKMTSLDKYAGVLLGTFLALCVAMIYFKVANSTYLRLIAPVLIWPAASLLVNTRVGKWCEKMSEYSFFIFISHAPILIASWMVYSKVSIYVPYELYWVVTPVVTVVVLIATYKLAQRFIPSLFSFVLGCRQKAVSESFIMKVELKSAA